MTDLIVDKNAKNIYSRHIPGINKITYREMIYFLEKVRQPADSTFKDLQTAEFKIELRANQYIYLNSAIFVFLTKFKKRQ